MAGYLFAVVPILRLASDGDKDHFESFARLHDMAWYSITVATRSGEAIALSVLSRANNPATWSLESLGGIVFRQSRIDADSFFFCPKAAVVFQPLIAANGGKPCVSPLVGTFRQTKSSRIVLGFKTDWHEMRRPERRQQRLRINARRLHNP
jgi:hypothetical protein